MNNIERLLLNFKDMEKTNLKRKIVIFAIILYLVVTCISFYKLSHYTYGLFDSKPRFGLNDMSLDHIPYFQKFYGYNVMGLRLYLKNEDHIKDGNVYVNLGSYSTGEIFLKRTIAVKDISNSYDTYIDVFSEKPFKNLSGEFWYSIYTDPQLDGKIKVQYYGHQKSATFLMHVGKHLYDYREKTMVYNLLQRKIPFMFIAWIFMTAVYVTLIVNYNVVYKDLSTISTNKYSVIESQSLWIHRMLLMILIIIGLVGTELIRPSTFYENILFVSFDDGRFDEGLPLQEKTVTTFKFTCIEKNLNAIRIKLDSYPADLAEYTLVLSDSNDDYISDVFSSDMDFDGKYLFWNISEFEFKENEEYKIDVFFPLKGDKVAPIIKGLWCQYGEEGTISKRKIGICLAIIGVAFAFIILYKRKKRE